MCLPRGIGLASLLQEKDGEEDERKAWDRHLFLEVLTWG